MISRSTLVGALVVAELGIVGLATQAVAGGSAAPPSPPAVFGFGTTLGALDAPGSGQAGRLNRSFLAGPAPRVVIDVPDVDVTVVGTTTTAVHADESLAKAGFISGEIPALVAEQTGDGVRVSSSGTGHVHFVIGSLQHTLRLTVPAYARVEFAAAGRATSSGLRSKLMAHIPEGVIDIRDHRGDVDVSTGDGKIVLTDVQGSDIALNTRSGRIYLTRVGADRMNGTSSTGRIVGVDVRAVDGTLTTRDGRVVLSFTGDSDAVVSAHTADGRVRVTGFSVMESDRQRSVIRLGTGRGHFEVSTSDGPITITPGASV